MKTLLYKKEDGFNVVVGFGKMLIDGVATKDAIGKEAKKLDLYREVNQMAFKICELKGRQKAEEQIKSLTSDFNEKKLQLEKKMLEIYNKSVTYFELGSEELALTDEQYLEAVEVYSSIKPSQKLVIDDSMSFSLVDDSRGVKYYVGEELDEFFIEKLGEVVPHDAILELTAKQANDKSGGDLKAGEINVILQSATKMRSGLEITGADPAIALNDSKAWYQSELAKIEAKYA